MNIITDANRFRIVAAEDTPAEDEETKKREEEETDGADAPAEGADAPEEDGEKPKPEEDAPAEEGEKPEEDADEEKKPAEAKKGVAHASGVAYAGGKMTVGMWDAPIVVDLAGMECSAPVPLLANHENHVRSRLGLVTPTVADGALSIDGEIDEKAELAETIVRQARAGAAWQLSIGAEVVDAVYIDEGTVEINGAEHEAPFYHVTKSVLREVSVVAVGADRNTSMSIAASADFHMVGVPMVQAKAAFDKRLRGLQAEKDREVAKLTASLADAQKDLKANATALDAAKADAEQLGAKVKELEAALAESREQLACEQKRYQSQTGRALRPASSADAVASWNEAVDKLGFVKACEMYPHLRPAVGCRK